MYKKHFFGGKSQRERGARKLFDCLICVICTVCKQLCVYCTVLYNLYCTVCKVWGSWQYPIGDKGKGLFIKFGYYNSKEQGSVWGSFQLFKFDWWKCSGVGHKLKSWQVSYITHLIILNGSQSD